MTHQSWAFYDQLLEQAYSEAVVAEVIVGATWVLCRTEPVPGQSPTGTVGLAMGPPCRNRSLPWAGRLRGRPLHELQSWVCSWDPHASAVGMAAANAGLGDGDGLAAAGEVLPAGDKANLAVLYHFRSWLLARKVVVIGRYPGMEALEAELDLIVLERDPGPRDLPDTAAEYVLPEAEWVFLSASTLTNKTFPHLAELAADANLVLMGPSVPWHAGLARHGIDYLAGVTVADLEALRATVAEGGGTRLFEEAVRYRVAELPPPL